jgi:hypothetical protein
MTTTKKCILALVLSWTLLFSTCNIQADLTEAANIIAVLVPIIQQLIPIVVKGNAAVANDANLALDAANAASSGINGYMDVPNATNLQKAQASVAALVAADTTLQQAGVLAGSSDTTVGVILGVIKSSVAAIAAVVNGQTAPGTTAMAAMKYAGQKVVVGVNAKGVKSVFNRQAGKDSRLKPLK